MLKVALVPLKSPKTSKPFDLAAVIDRQLDLEAQTIKREFEKTVATFETKVTFETDSQPGERQVFTHNQIYFYLARGTRPHIIRPVKAKVLAFGSTFKPKTKVQVINSYPGGSSPPTAFAQAVQHPGTDARDFDEVIKARVERRFARRLQAAIDKAATKAK